MKAGAEFNQLRARFHPVQYRPVNRRPASGIFPSYPSDTRLLRLNEACLKHSVRALRGGTPAAAHDGVREGGGTIQFMALERGQPLSRARRPVC
jgi:hypothetical protein